MRVLTWPRSLRHIFAVQHGRILKTRDDLPRWPGSGTELIVYSAFYAGFGRNRLQFDDRRLGGSDFGYEVDAIVRSDRQRYRL